MEVAAPNAEAITLAIEIEGRGGSVLRVFLLQLVSKSRFSRMKTSCSSYPSSSHSKLTSLLVSRASLLVVVVVAVAVAVAAAVVVVVAAAVLVPGEILIPFLNPYSPRQSPSQLLRTLPF